MSRKSKKKRTGAHTKAASLKYKGASVSTPKAKNAAAKKPARRRRAKAPVPPWRRRKRTVLIAAALAVCVVGLAAALIISNYVVSQTEDYVLTPEEAAGLDADCVMVLGCGLTDEGEPGRNLTRRLESGLELFEAGAGRKLMMSGDHGRKKYDEVNAMKDWATERGAASADVFMDHAGFSTYESMYRARDVFDVDSVVIVSQEYHMARALYDARVLGLEAYGVAAEGGSGVRNDIREVLARCKDWLWCLLQPEPTYLGDVIPISGSGDMTNDRVTPAEGTELSAGDAA